MSRCPLIVLTLLWCCTFVTAADQQGLAPDVKTAVKRGLGFLVTRQAADGSFGNDPSKVSTTSRALLALLGSGDAPETGQYNYSIRQAIEWLLSQQASDGYFGQGERSARRQAVATLALAEAYGADTDVLRRSRLGAALQKAAETIVASQTVAGRNPNSAGGWNGPPNAADSTLAVTTTALLALRACQDIGVSVPAQTFKSAGEFVLRCYDGQSGGFGPAPSTAAQTPSTAAGLVCLRLLNLTTEHAAQVDGAIKYLTAHPIDGGAPIGYAAINIITLCTYEMNDGALSSIGQSMLTRLARSQDKDGGWPQPQAGSRGRTTQDRMGATAAALQALTIPYQFLPIYQR